MDPNTPITNPQPEAAGPKRKNLVIIAIIVGVLVIVGLIALGISLAQPKQQGTGKSDDKIANQFYDTLGNAAKQPKLRVAMFRQTFVKKADADAKQNVGSTQSSIAQLDTGKKTYENVYATEISGTGKGFHVGRCAGAISYGVTDSEAGTITSLTAAVQRLKQPLTRDTPGTVSDSCKAFGVPAGATSDLAYARLTDGVFPITLQQNEGNDWVQKLKAGALFTVKDEGLVTRNSQQLRKLSFEPKSKENENNINATLYDYFKEAVQLEKLKRDNPNALYQYAFIGVNPGITGGVKGFYLIDEKTNLPVYSELQGISRDRDGDPTTISGRNIARSTFTYDFVLQNTIDVNTPLEILE